MNIKYRLGDATNPIFDSGDALIVHSCNDISVWGAGFVLPLGSKWPKTKKEYMAWFNRGYTSVLVPLNSTVDYERVKDRNGANYVNFSQGKVQFVQVESNTWVCNLIGQSGIGPFEGYRPCRYESIKEGCLRIRQQLGKFNNPSIHTVRMASGLGGGEFRHILTIFDQVFGNTDIDVTIYDIVDQGEKYV